ncbi:hypothetical protein D5086_005073 [Populus alba]|uniref:Uncharacterized protein n=1 Tax=Populus alba TaxID=43335 RepID=A0ACC4CUD1_POPAL
MDQEISELCDSYMSSFLPPPYNNISNIICRPVRNTFLLRYHEKEDDVVTSILSAVYTTGWVAMGFSKDGRMVGSTAMLSLKTLSLPSQLYWLLEPANPNHYRLSSHDDKTTILFDFTAGSMSKARINPGQMKKNHEVLGTLAWGLFLPSGAIVARYLKHKEPLWYYLHAEIGFLSKAKERCQDLQVLEMVPPLVWKDCPLLWSLQYCVGNPFRSCGDVMEGRLSFSNHYDETLSWLRRSENTTPPETFQMNPIQLLFRGLG